MGKHPVGRRGLALSEVRRLERLIAAGLDEKSILKATGVSKQTLRKAQLQTLPAQRPQCPWGRCESCGVLVKLPCVACRVKRWQRAWAAMKLLKAKRKRKK